MRLLNAPLLLLLPVASFPGTSTRRPPGPCPPVSGVMNARSGPWAPPESFITASTAQLCLPLGGLRGPSSKGPSPPTQPHPNPDH